MANARPRPLVLCILDGFGERAERADNAIRLAKSPNLDALFASYPHTLIGTSGPDVGLPVGQMGNSEVGHLNFGAGRVARMDITRIDVDVAEETLDKNPVIADVMARASESPKKRIHLFGLVSDGGVHSSLDHLRALIELADFRELKVVIHAFLDGRDTPPRSAMGYLEKIEGWLDDGKRGVIGTISGRYYAMDRDKRWDRVNEAYSAIVRGKGVPRAPTPYDLVEDAYVRQVSDEFIEPTRIGDYNGFELDLVCEFGAPPGAPEGEWHWRGKEVGFSFNFRPDRMRELSAMLINKGLPSVVVEEYLTDNERRVVAFHTGDYATMTEYDRSLALPVAYPKENVTESFGEVIARAGLAQLRCAETEKYAHVTYFFNGGREEPFEREDRKMVPSPRDVATYDLKPEMSAAEVARVVTLAVESGKYDFVLVNFANPDMVGHTGFLDAAVHAVEAVDLGVGQIAEAVKKAGGALIVTADHGNCEQMKDASGQPHTAHTTNPVPLLYVNDADKDVTLRAGGKIADVAPMMLEILGIEQPSVMTGKSLRVEGPAKAESALKKE